MDAETFAQFNNVMAFLVSLKDLEYATPRELKMVSKRADAIYSNLKTFLSCIQPQTHEVHMATAKKPPKQTNKPVGPKQTSKPAGNFQAPKGGGSPHPVDGSQVPGSKR